MLVVFTTLNFKLIQVKSICRQQNKCNCRTRIYCEEGKILCSVSSCPNKIIATGFVLKKLTDKFGFTTKVTGTCSIERLIKHAE